MRISILSTLFFLSFLPGCTGQAKTKPETLYNEDFKWTITIPENFINVSPQEWAKMQDKGLDAVEKTFGEEVVNQSKVIFVFKNADFNYLEANYQLFNVETDGDYLESCKAVNEILFETFKTQMPNAKIDSISSIEKISNLDFQTFKMKIYFPNGMTMHSIMYSRLFEDREFSVNIMYVDERQGKRMIEAWTKSTFE
ncbi:MAG: hypothetical protein KF803_06655 [Cyclobacteriaceae bacterium]|nr:hypothetical protein [Cyclobacteriaceae bacterium]